MSSYPYDIIIIDNKEHLLQQKSPLEQIWNHNNRPLFNKKLSISEYKIDYEAKWEIKDGALWLIELLSETKIDTSVFPPKTGGKIKATWFTGSITHGIGTPESGLNSPVFYEHLKYEFTEGILSDKEKEIIIRYPKHAEAALDFGKHNGRQIEDIIIGINIYEEKDIIEKYLHEALSTYKNGVKFTKKNVYLPTLPIESREELFHGKFYTIAWNGNIFDKYIYTKNTQEQSEITEVFTSYIVEMFSKSFIDGDFFLSFIEYGDQKTISHASLALKPDPQYINWLIDNVSNFLIPPHIIDQELTCRELLGIKMEKIAYDLIRFTPIVQEYNFKFTSEALEKSINKYDKKYNLLYNTKNKWYLKKPTPMKLVKSKISDNNNFTRTEINYDELYFDAITDGQLGEFYDFNGDIDNIDSWLND